MLCRSRCAKEYRDKCLIPKDYSCQFTITPVVSAGQVGVERIVDLPQVEQRLATTDSSAGTIDRPHDCNHKSVGVHRKKGMTSFECLQYLWQHRPKKQ